MNVDEAKIDTVNADRRGGAVKFENSSVDGVLEAEINEMIRWKGHKFIITACT